MTKKLAAAALALLLILALTAAASASQSPDPTAPGSITFLLDWDGEPLEGGSLTMYRVALLDRVEGEFRFVLIPELLDSGLPLEQLDDPALVPAFEKLAREKNLSPITAPISGGKAVFENLTPGVYLVVQQESTQGFAPLNSFLISLPQLRQEQYVYDLTLEPKVGLETEPTEATEPTEPQPTQPPDPSLPQTGQLNWPVPLLCVSGAALFILGWYLAYGKQWLHHEN